jgi:phenylacetaldehyde dehydrogenase
VTFDQVSIDLSSVLHETAREHLARTHANLIGGVWRAPETDERIPVVDPATGQVIASIPASGAPDIDHAVAAARTALETGAWPAMPGHARGRLLRRLAELIEAEAGPLAQLEALDTGRPVFECQIVDLPGSIAMLDYMSGWASKIEGETIPVSLPPGTFHAYTEREPVGVVGVIVPWNYPLELAIWRIAPALAAGCTVVLKPAEQTSLTALRLGALIERAGFPPGVVNIVTGYGATAGAALAGHDGVDAVSFTGSTVTGRAIVQAATGNLKRVFLELGGKSPMVVMPDADLDQAIAGVAGAIFFSSGQICTAGSRLIVHDAIHDRMVDGIRRIAEGLKVGHGLDPETRLGPLVSDVQLGRVLSHLDDGAREGATYVTGGHRLGTGGCFVAPTIATDVAPHARLLREEIFGPVLCVQRFSDADMAVRLANDTPYGLHASVWTRDLSTAHLMARRIKAGNVCINTHNFFDPAFPMGGYKQSGWGRAAGHAALEHYTEMKGIVAKL